MNLSKNRVLITGGTSGIGLELAKKFKFLKNQVIITGRNPATLEKVAKENDFEYLVLNLSVQESIDHFLKEVVSKHQDLNVLINNAGVQYNYDFKEERNPDFSIEDEINVNFTAPVKLCAHLIPTLLKQTSSAIVTISSGLALSPKRSAAVYCGSKAAIHMYTKALRYQLENTNIKVFEIIPPLVDTPMTHGRGKSKMTTVELVEEFIRGFKNNKYEIYIGKVKLLRLLHRVYPGLAYKILKNN